MQHHRTNNPYEAEFGYSRAVRKGPFIFVSGTTSIDPVSGELRYPGSAYDQARAIFGEIVRVVDTLGGSKSDVVRVRMFVAEDEDMVKVGEALKDALGDVSPAATMIVGSRFVSPDMLVEIEADAVVMVFMNVSVRLGSSLRFNATPFEDPLFYLLSIASAYIHIS